MRLLCNGRRMPWKRRRIISFVLTRNKPCDTIFGTQHADATRGCWRRISGASRLDANRTDTGRADGNRSDVTWLDVPADNLLFSGLHGGDASPVKLAIVHDWLTGMRGGETCLERICRRFPDARLFTLVHRRGSVSPTIEQTSITTSFLQRLPGAQRHYRYLLPLMPRAIESLVIPADVDVVLSFSHAVAKAVRPPAGVPHVCYCFTPMRYVWHLRGEYFAVPGSVEGGIGLAGRLVRAPWSAARNLLLDRIRQWDAATHSRVTQFVAASQTVRQRIAECYGREAELVFPPVDTDFYTPGAGEREDFYLCVSALVPYKRLDLAIQACNQLGRRLIVIGSGPERRRLQRLAGHTVCMLGWQPREVIRDHLRRCRALLFPGHEDFGIVPVEAQACGAPVIALGRGGATETVLPCSRESPGTGVFFNTPTSAALAAAIVSFEQNAHRFVPTLARRQAERFAAVHFEKRLVRILERVVAQGTSCTPLPDC